MTRSVATAVCVGEEFSLFLSNEGDVYSVGKNSNRGHGHEEECVFPIKKISTLQNIQSIACGYDHTICLDYSGTVFTFGRNRYGQLGVGKDVETLSHTYVPQKLDLPLIIQIACGTDFNMCVTEDGLLYSFGEDEYGQLGIGNTALKKYNFPQKVMFLKDVHFISCGANHTICQTVSNDIYCWGSNDHGQLGLDIGKNQLKKFINIPRQCQNWPDNIVDIKCGYDFTIVLTSNQELFSCGSNTSGQLGRDKEYAIFNSKLKKIPNLSEIMKVECGKSHVSCIDVYHNFFIFGENDYGQLGIDTIDETTTSNVIHRPLSNIIDISSGGNHTFVKTSNNEIYAFGDNLHSQLGIETRGENQLTPIRVFEGNEDIWYSNFGKSKAKSARK